MKTLLNATKFLFTHLMAVVVIVGFSTCQKDYYTTLSNEPSNVIKPKSHIPEVRVEAARRWFDQNFDNNSSASFQGDNLTELNLNIVPKWDEAWQSEALTGRPILVVPFNDSIYRMLNNQEVGFRLIFAYTGTDSIGMHILMYAADPGYYQSVNGGLDLSSFTGFLSFFNVKQRHEWSIYVNNGIARAGSDSISYRIDADDRECIWITRRIYICPNVFAGGCWAEVMVYLCDDGGGIDFSSGSYWGPFIGGGNGNPSGGNNNQNPPNWDWWTGGDWVDAVMDGIPLDVFLSLEQGNGLPEGMTLEEARLLWEMAAAIDLTAEQLEILSNSTLILERTHQILLDQYDNVRPITSQQLDALMDFLMNEHYSMIACSFAGEFLDTFDLGGLNADTLYKLLRVGFDLSLEDETIRWLQDHETFLVDLYSFFSSNTLSQGFIDFIRSVIQINILSEQLPDQSLWTLEEMEFVFDNLEGVVVALEEPTNPVSLQNPICPQILNFEYRINPEDNNYQYTGLILSNAYFSFNAQGDPILLQVVNLSFNVYANANSSYLANTSTYVANSINQTVITLQQMLNLMPSGSTNEEILIMLKGAFLRVIDRDLRTQVQNDNSNYHTNVAALGNPPNNFDNLPVINVDASMINCQ